MTNPFDTQKWDANVRFNALVASLTAREQTIGQMADGSPLVVTVPVAVAR